MLAAWCVPLVALVGFAWCSAYGKWSAQSWHAPIQYLDGFYGDVVEGYAQAKAVTEGEYVPFTWKLIERLGAPFDGNWTDRPSVEEINVFFLGIAAKVFGIFAGLNASLLLGHVLAAISFFLVAIAFDCSRLWAFIGGLAFGLAPYIFAQSPHHITVAYCWHVPLFLLVWRWVTVEPSMEWRSPRFWTAIGIAIVAGLQNPYYTNILCQLTLLGAGTLAWRRGSWAPLKPACAIIVVAAVAFALMNLDTWTYKLVHGPNTGALVREYKWMEIYGLKLVDLVIPPATHHSDAFAAFAIKHKIGDPARGIPPASPLQDEGSYLGIVGLVALGWLVWTAVADAVKGRANDIPLAAWQVLWIVICFTTGGLNAILGAFGFTLFRTGQRYSIVILAIALLYATQRLTAWQRQAAASTPAEQLRIVVLTAAASLCALILWDQVPRAPSREQTATLARQVDADREFTGKMETALPAGAMVFQMPVMEFPESPLPGIPSYDHFRPYLYSKNLRYSYGSMKGRERERWQSAVQGKFFESATLDQKAGIIRVNEANARVAVDELKRLGFSAIYVNRNGFPDRGKGLEEALLALGYDKPPIRNATGDLACIVLEK
jgi:hypothetical protein